MVIPRIKELSARYFRETVNNRRHLHQYPELSFQEAKTAAFIAAKLTEYGISFTPNVAGHGIVAVIEGQNPTDKCIALRADIDALPLNEHTQLPYSSAHNGVMHACGHDAHTAMLLTAARILLEMKNHFNGTIKLIFQHAEEKLPGGALDMLAANVLENPVVSCMIGLHVLPELESGKAGFRPGPFMASGDEINIRVHGKGGHAAMPDQINDTVLIASQIVVGLQQVVSRMAPPLVPTVLSFGRLIADGAHNVIPNEVLIQGTFRTFDENWRKKAKELIAGIAQQTAAAAGARAEVTIDSGYPVLINDPHTTTNATSATAEFLGNENIVALDQRMTTEDFAWYSQKVPACFIRLGTGNASKGITAGLHTPTFDIDENSLETGSGLLAWIALKQLDN